MLAEKRVCQTVRRKVIKTIKEALGITNMNIYPGYTLDDLSADSLSTKELIMAIEELLGIDDITPMLKREWDNQTTVKEIIDFTITVC